MLSPSVWNKDRFYILLELPTEHAYRCKYEMKTLILLIVLVAIVGVDSGLLSTLSIVGVEGGAIIHTTKGRQSRPSGSSPFPRPTSLLFLYFVSFQSSHHTVALWQAD